MRFPTNCAPHLFGCHPGDGTPGGILTGVAPTLILKYAEAVDCYLSWRWTDQLCDVHTAHISAAATSAVRSVLAEALPEPINGEDQLAALTRALSVGAFATAAATEELLCQLSDLLLPAPLVQALMGCPSRPRLRIQPSGSLASVPWPILRVRPDRRILAEIADIRIGVPSAIAATAAQVNPEPAQALVAVIDPQVPGYRADSVFGSVLGRPRTDDVLSELLAHPALRPTAASYVDVARRKDLDRNWLRAACKDAARLLYVGHVSAAGEESALHLCCRSDDGSHQPLRVADLLGGQGDPWRIPPRVAMIGCGSGTDLRYPEPMGMSLAMVLCGAYLVTATLWTLPTELALADAGDRGQRQPLRELILAVDRAHRQADPVAALTAWQTQRAQRWQHHGHPADSPLLWASLITIERSHASPSVTTL